MKFATYGVAAALAAIGTQVLAEESVEPAAAPVQAEGLAPAPFLAAEVAVAVEESLSSLFESATALSESELGEQRAAAKIELGDVTINDSEQNGAVAGNAALNNQTGGNSITGDAFVGASGFINSIQNTGNNVLIQNSTIINVSVEP